jgi:hypothetical protein
MVGVGSSLSEKNVNDRRAGGRRAGSASSLLDLEQL